METNTGDLTPKQEQFCQQYLIDLNATQAAIRAGYSVDTAYSIGSENLKKPEVQQRIASLQAERSERTRITADKVLSRWWDIATADPNELIQLQRVACRHCHGEGFKYQYTPAEWADAVKHQTEKAPADPKGGVGYDRRKDPHPDCPECNGLGRQTLQALDTRKLSGQARLLYAGAKEGKDGLEIKLQDQGKALDNVAKHLGMFKEKLEVTGKDGEPLNGTPEERFAAVVALLERARARANPVTPPTDDGREVS